MLTLILHRACVAERDWKMAEKGRCGRVTSKHPGNLYREYGHQFRVVVSTMQIYTVQPSDPFLKGNITPHLQPKAEGFSLPKSGGEVPTARIQWLTTNLVRL